MHPLFDIWEDKSPLNGKYPWRAQLVKYVAEFSTKAAAERFVEAVKKTRKQWGLK